MVCLLTSLVVVVACGDGSATTPIPPTLSAPDSAPSVEIVTRPTPTVQLPRWPELKPASVGPVPTPMKGPSASIAPEKVRGIGSLLQPVVDDWLIAEMGGVSLRLHSPAPRDGVLEFDRPWEGAVSLAVQVMKDADLYSLRFR